MKKNHSEDWQLWEKYQTCSHEAIYELFKKYHGYFFHKAFGILNDRMITRDVVSETQLSFLERRKSDKKRIKIKDSVFGYLSKSIYYKANNTKKTLNRTDGREFSELSDKIVHIFNNGIWINFSNLDCVLDQLARIGELSDSQKIIWKYSVMGDKPSDIHKKVSYSLTAINTHKSEAYRKIKAKRGDLIHWLEQKSDKVCKKTHEKA